MNKNPDDLSFFAHYEELRSRLIRSAVTVLVAACFVYAVAGKVLVFIIKPIGRLVFTAPGEAFIAHITVALFGGVFLAFPVVLYQVWRFVASGLRPHEAKYVRIFAPWSLFLFVAGAAFAYFIVVPISIRFLLSFSNDVIVPMITVKNYISFIGTMLLAFGIAFELPLVLMFLAKAGLTTPVFLAHKRKYAVVVILTVSALITPPDVVTQLMMAAPLVILYEAGIVAARLACSE